MTDDASLWLADAVGLPVLSERADGTLAVNDVAHALLGGAVPARAADAIASLVGRTDPARPLEEALADARRGAHRAVELPGREGDENRAGAWRVFLAPHGSARARAVCVPPNVAQAAQIRRRAAVADAALSACHELANALGAIEGWAGLGGRGETPAAEALATIESAAADARGVARAVLGAASAPVDDDPAGPFDASEVLEQVVRLVRPLALSSRVTLDSRIAAGMWATGRRRDLFTAAWNLAKNAVEAMPTGGPVGVFAAADATSIRIMVSDNGPGIAPEDTERVFLPHYTTKPGGTGLGLSLVRHAVVALGGSLELQLRPRGTSFVVRLPLAPAPPGLAGPTERPSRRAAAPRADAWPHRLLVVDDDDALRDMVAAGLSLRGATVTAVSTAAEAHRLEGPYDVALVDLNLRDGRGDELGERLRTAGVARRVLLTSGATRPDGLRNTGEPDGWLRKPFALAELLDRLRELLPAGAGTP